MSWWQLYQGLNLPNKLTLLRIGLIPLFMFCLLSNYLWGQYAALAIFILAAITDYWDGRLARERKLETNFGKIMDPLADKLLMTAAFVCFVQMAYAPAWMVILIIGREFAITGLRVLAAVDGRVIAASPAGKHKTVSQIIAVILILTVNAIVISLNQWSSNWMESMTQSGMGGQMVLTIINQAPYWAMLIVAVLSLFSGLDYLIKNKGLLKE